MTTLTVIALLAGFPALGAQPAKKRPAVSPVCKAENRLVRRAAIDLRAAINETPDAKWLRAWEKGIVDAGARLDAEIEMSDNRAAALKKSFEPYLYKRWLLFVACTKARIHDEVEDYVTLESYQEVLDREKQTVDALNVILDCGGGK